MIVASERVESTKNPNVTQLKSDLCSKRCLGFVAAAIAAMALAHIADVHHLSMPARWFSPVHIALEMASVVVALTVFTTGWFGYKQTGNVQDLVIAATFATAGALDFVHTLSYQGMPDFLGINSPGKAAAYWLLARAIVGIGLLITLALKPTSAARPILPASLVGISLTIIAASVSILTKHGQQIAIALYPTIGRPPSLLKAIFECAIILLYIGALILLKRQVTWQISVKRNLKSALVIAIVAEAAFMLYLTPYAWTNAIGHLLKTASYALILNALFVSAISRPYQELARARDELELLYEDAKEHRAEIERSFARVGKALSSSLKLQEALDLIADLVQQMQHADCVVVMMTEKARGEASVASQKGVCHNVENPVHVTAKLAKQALQSSSTIVIDDLEQTGWISCDFSHETCLRSAVCAPMIYDTEALGVIAVYSYSKAGFEEWDIRLLEGFASHAAVAIHNAISYERESTVAEVLQRTFISGSNLSSDRFEITQVYEPASNEALVGGDFYDAFELPDGKTALVIGDVSGKGLAAAVHTAMIRYTLRAYLNEGHSPAATLDLLNRITSQLTDDDTFVTLFLGVLDPSTAELVYASAGHEPAIYIHGDNRLSLPATGIPLGVDVDAHYEEGRIALEIGGILLLYTDGISEARRESHVLGVEGIEQQLLTCKTQTSADVAKCVHNKAIEFAGGELKDDAAILAVRRVY
jgi:sigma-B regulation protein RsbU (phosphoserine phosphatase)